MKPNIIREIEEFYGIKLHKEPFEVITYKETERAYAINARGEVIGLHIANQKFSDISILSNLRQLRFLDISSNGISDIRPIKKLDNLQIIIMNNNNVSDLSPLQNLTNLIELFASYNRISDISPLQNLVNLRVIDLEENYISDITYLQNLIKLNILNISMNKILDISVVRNFSKLECIYMANNKIIDITPLQNLNRLKKIFTVANQIQKITIDFLERLSNLGTIYLSDNPIQNLDNESIEYIYPQHILAYLHEEEGAPLYEAKVLVLGEPESGKTTLIKKMLNPNYKVEGLPTTHGIEINQYYFPDKQLNRTYTANMWDFGGQEIYHGTHRFFLSSRALYILVSDNRKEDTDFRYWLDKIKVFGKDSPLLIVQNEKDNRKKNLPTEVNIGDFPNLKQILQVNFADPNNTKFNDLVQAIQREFCALPHINLPFPKRWREVRTAIERRSEDYILYRDFKRICEEANISETESDIQAQLCQYLHDLGVLLHFKDVDLLKKYVILKPHWATKAVYQLIDFVGKGKFLPAEAEKVWAMPENKGIFADMTLELLAMIQEFEICYAHEGMHILPQLLSEDAPEYAWDNADNLQVVFRYGFMPKGILWRLMVRLHYLLPDDNLVWKRGAIFQREGAKAVVTETNDVYKREIRIKVAGKERKELLVILLNEMGRINGTYNFDALEEEKRPQIEVPCNCSKCKNSPNPHFYKYKKLKKRLEDNVLDVECDESYEKVKVRTLIDEIRHTLENKTPLTDSERKRVESLLDEGNLPAVFAILDRCSIESQYSFFYHQKKGEFINPPQGKSTKNLVDELRVLISTGFMQGSRFE